MTKRIVLVLWTLVLSVCCKAQTSADHVRLTNLPHVYLNTFTGSSITSKETTVYARMWYVDEQDQTTFYDSLLVRVRGNSTANLAKKPYKLKFNEKVKLLGKGRPNTKKWTLLANHADKSLMRNALTSLMGEFAGLKFNPAAKFVDLTLNGQYVGNYQLSDQVDVRPHRVNVVEQDLPLTSTSNISGGYLLEADGFRDYVNGKTGFYTNKRVPVRIHYPDEEDIENTQYNYIRNFVQNFETRLFSATFSDPKQGYRPLVDSVSLANWYLCTEVSANVDGFFSTYFYKEQDDDRLFWGPLWDYDIAYNNDSRSDRGGTNNTERQLMKDTGYGASGSGCREWMQQMWKDPWFARLVNRRYKELVDAGLEDYLNTKIDSLVTLLDASQQLNFERWGISSKVLRERVLFSTYDEYIDYLRNFIHLHMDYLSSAFAALLPDTPEPKPEVEPSDFVADEQSYYAISNLAGGTFFDVDMATDEVCGRSRNTSSDSQLWHLKNLSNGCLFIVNKATGKSLYDPSPAGSTATTNVGSTLMVAASDSADQHQQWRLVAQAGGCYNIISRWSGHAANLSGGNSADGTRIVSYTSDGRNSQSGNRQWTLEKAGAVSGIGDCVPDVDYALAYDAQTGRLHFGADDRQSLTFTARIYGPSGRLVASFPATDDMMMNTLPDGLYIVSWSFNGRQHSVKLMKK